MVTLFSFNAISTRRVPSFEMFYKTLSIEEYRIHWWWTVNTFFLLGTLKNKLLKLKCQILFSAFWQDELPLCLMDFLSNPRESSPRDKTCLIASLCFKLSTHFNAFMSIMYNAAYSNPATSLAQQLILPITFYETFCLFKASALELEKLNKRK